LENDIVKNDGRITMNFFFVLPVGHPAYLPCTFPDVFADPLGIGRRDVFFVGEDL
jgi:hypothetical protein